MTASYQPPFTLTNNTITLVASISEAIGRLHSEFERQQLFRLRKVNRMRTVQGSLAIEGNTLSEHQITALLSGKTIIAPPKEVQEAKNAIAAYEQLHDWQPNNEQHLLAAHYVMMKSLIDDMGEYRRSGVGVMAGNQVAHMAPQPKRVPQLMQQLFAWLRDTDAHPLVASSVFHYEFEFIHPFSDGNGRMGRLWQALILKQWHKALAFVPVESIVHQHQQGYYQAIQQSTQLSDAYPFVEFMLQMILQALHASIDEKPTANHVEDNFGYYRAKNGGLNDGVNVFLNLNIDGAITPLQAQILSQIHNNPRSTIQLLAQQTQKSTRTIERQLKRLKEQDRLVRHGPDKTGYWSLK